MEYLNKKIFVVFILAHIHYGGRYKLTILTTKVANGYEFKVAFKI